MAAALDLRLHFDRRERGCGRFRDAIVARTRSVESVRAVDRKVAEFHFSAVFFRHVHRIGLRRSKRATCRREWKINPLVLSMKWRFQAQLTWRLTMAHGLVVPLSDERNYPGPGTSLRGTRSPVLNCFIGYWLLVGGKRTLSCPNPLRGLQLTNALGTSSVVSKTAAFPRWQNGAISIAVPQSR